MACVPARKVKMDDCILFNCECENVISSMPDNYVDLVVTSPPYNVDLGKNKFNKHGYDEYVDRMPHDEYISKLSNVFGSIMRILKDSGRVCINIGNAKNGQVTTVSDLIYNMKDMGYGVLAQIVWDKSNVSNRASFGSYMSPSCPSFPTPFEYVLVFYKGNKRLCSKGETDISKQEFVSYANSLWRFPGEKKSATGHPAAFPVELPYRCIKMLSWKGATVFDPYMGSGTTGVACMRTGRKFIGCEISANYFGISAKRISDEIASHSE